MDKLAEIQDEIRSLREEIRCLLTQIGEKLGISAVPPASIIELRLRAEETARKLTNGSKAKRRR